MNRRRFPILQKIALGLLLSTLTMNTYAASSSCQQHYIQSFVSSIADTAQSMKNTFNAKGFPTIVMSVNSDGRTLYRVRTGPFANETDAEQLQVQMKAALPDHSAVQGSVIIRRYDSCNETPKVTEYTPEKVETPNPARLQFKDYPATSRYEGENHPLVMTEFGKNFKTRLGQAIKTAKPSFAGEYIVIGWGCGSGGCNTGAVINAKTGVATPFPVSLSSVYPLKSEFGEEDGQQHLYRLDSRLMVFAGNLEGSTETTGKDMVEVYEFNNGKFIFLESQPYGRSPAN